MRVSEIFASRPTVSADPYLVLSIVVRYDLVGKVIYGQGDVPAGHGRRRNVVWLSAVE
jgi:hypothetical protein